MRVKRRYMNFKVDGNTSLKDQEITLSHTEKHGVLKLASYTKNGSPENPHDNDAEFEDRDIGTVLPDLVLTESATGTEVWVEGTLKKITTNR
jgi:hypothetical protein